MEKSGSPVEFQTARNRTYLDSRAQGKGCNIVAVAAQGGEWTGTNEIRAEFVIVPNSNFRSQKVYEALKIQEEEIETELGESLTWDAPVGRKKQKILLFQEISTFDESAWPDQHAWLKSRLEALHRVFKKRLDRLV